MRRTLSEHRRDFIAVVALTAAAIFSTTVILTNQGAQLPTWVPLVGSDRFELKAEFSTAQAVTPGQGQSINVAGIRVGDVTEVELKDGHAVVTFQVENKYANLINEDASLLTRPKTGLNDMVVEVDPGTGNDVEEGAVLPLASTLPNVNPDEVLAALDADTQGFLRLLLSGGARGIGEEGRGRKLAAAFRQFEPLGRDLSRLSGLLAKRRANISRSIHNFGLLSQELADKDQDLTTFVDTQNEVLQSFANQEASIRGALQELPGALDETNKALISADDFAVASLPALRDSLPGARALAPALRRSRDLFRESVAPIRDQIRPFTRQVRTPITHLRQVSEGLAVAIPNLKTSFLRLNEGFNALAANPAGTDEGYLFHLAWMNHNLNSVFTLQDAHGPLRRGTVALSCGTSRLADNVFQVQPFLTTLAELTTIPTTSEIC